MVSNAIGSANLSDSGYTRSSSMKTGAEQGLSDKDGLGAAVLLWDYSSTNTPKWFYGNAYYVSSFYDEYGAFGTCHTIDRNKPDDNRLYYTFNGEYQVRDNEIGTYSDNFYVCGLCGDYCVQETIKNLRKNPHFNVVAIEDLIKSIDNGESFNKYKEETNLKTI